MKRYIPLAIPLVSAPLVVATIVIATMIIGCSQKQGPKIEPIPITELEDDQKSTINEIDINKISEVDLVEKLAEARADYKKLLVILNHWYIQHGNFEKAQWAAKEYEDLKFVRTYPYLVDIEIQKADLSPKENIKEADKLYEEALKLYREGQIAPLINDKKKLKLALDKFIELIKKYPTSDKIDDAAFYAAEILKEYFDDTIQAIRYYELAMKWNPKTPHPVRFQCAVLYDFRLHNRAKALELYRKVLEEEAEIDKTNTNFAKTRIEQLLTEIESERKLKEKIPTNTQASPSEKIPEAEKAKETQ